jgi:hypothetical protein
MNNPFFVNKNNRILERQESIVNMSPVKPSYSCIRCNYIVISPHNTCIHNQCDYCLTKYKICKLCIKNNVLA